MMLAKAFRENVGIEQEKAEALASTIFDAIRGNLASKSDLAALGAETKAEFAAVRADLRELEQRIDLKFGQVELKFEKIERQIDRVVVRLGGLVVVVAGLIVAASHLWPPH
jgi:hypothetical protein